MYKLNNDLIHRYLNNGMEVYLQPSDFAPIVSVQILVKVGAIDEEDSEAGIAHVLEHMLFKGTKKFPITGQVASTVEFEGGDINAYTTFDHTNYYLTGPSSFAQKGAELLLDVVQNSLLDEEELKRELEVIIEEIRRSRDSPNSVVSQNLFSIFYNGSRMARPVIGFEELVKEYTREKVNQFYKKWYIPNNMIFIAAGDFNAQEYFDYLQNLVTDFPAGSVPSRFRPKFPKPKDKNPLTKTKVERGAWQEARVQLALTSPSLEEHEMPQWDVFASILGEAESSRLSRVLRDELQLVTSIDCSCYSPKYPTGLFGVGYFCMANNALEALKITIQEIRRLAEVPPTAEELTRVSNSLKAQRIYSRESMDGITRNAGLSLQTSFKMKFEDLYTLSVASTKPKDIQEIAKKVVTMLEEEQFYISVALGSQTPEHLNEEKFIQTVQHAIQIAHHSNTNQDNQTLNPTDTYIDEKFSWLNSYQQSISTINAAIKQIILPLPFGKTLRINYRESKRLPIATGMLVTKGGLTQEPENKNGVGGLTASMLTHGTLRQNYRKFIEELEDNASSISAFSGRDLFGLRFDSMSENSLRTVQMLLDCFFRPEFSQYEWQKAYKETTEILIAQKDNPSARLVKQSQALLFPDHPYAHTSIGTEKTLKNVTCEDAKLFWQNLFQANEFIFSIAGDFDLRSIVTLIESEFKNYYDTFTEKKSLIQIHEPNFPDLKTNRVAFDELQREQAHITISFRSLCIHDSRRTALELAANILAGQGGRLFLDLRDKKSLAYSVSASQSPFILAGVFSLYIATAAHKAKEAIEGLKFHIEDLARTPPSVEELTRAQRSVLGAQSIESQHHSYQASQLAMSDVYGLGFDNFLKFSDRVNAITPEILSNVLKSLLNESVPIISIVGPKETWVPANDDPLLHWRI